MVAWPSTLTYFSVSRLLPCCFLKLFNICGKLAWEETASCLLFHYFDVYYVHNVYPVGIWCQNDVVSMSMRRNHVASTLIRRHLWAYVLQLFTLPVVPLVGYGFYDGGTTWLSSNIFSVYVKKNAGNFQTNVSTTKQDIKLLTAYR